MMGNVMKIMGIKPRLNSEAVTAIVGLITTIALLAFVRAIRPINPSLHRDLAGLALFLITALFFLWPLITSIRSGEDSPAMKS